jgi:hypothetical protein
VGDDLGVSLKLPPPKLSVPPISSACFANYHPLLGLISHPHRNELSTPHSNFGFRRAYDWLFFLVVVIRLVCFFVVYFSII